MSKSSELDKVVKRYIIDQIDASNYDDDPETIDEKIKFLHDTFLAEYGWCVDRIGPQDALREYYMGLPSSCHIAFYNHEILRLAREWGSLPEDSTGKQEDKILDNYWNFMAAKTCQLFNGYRIPA